MFIDNGWAGGRTHGEILDDLVEGSEGVIRLATGFVSPLGLLKVAQSTAGREVRLMVGDLRKLHGATAKNKIAPEVYESVCEWLHQPEVEVKTMDGRDIDYTMHSKTWIFSNAMVVGSANLTGAGLGLEQVQADRQPECSFLLKVDLWVEQARRWFDILWEPEDLTEHLVKLIEVKVTDPKNIDKSFKRPRY